MLEDEEFDEEYVDDGDSDDVSDCPHCGRTIYEQSEQCPHCGTWLEAEDAGNSSPYSWPQIIVIGMILCFLVFALWILGRTW